MAILSDRPRDAEVKSEIPEGDFGEPPALDEHPRDCAQSSCPSDQITATAFIRRRANRVQREANELRFLAEELDRVRLQYHAMATLGRLLAGCVR